MVPAAHGTAPQPACNRRRSLALLWASTGLPAPSNPLSAHAGKWVKVFVAEAGRVCSCATFPASDGLVLDACHVRACGVRTRSNRPTHPLRCETFRRLNHRHRVCRGASGFVGWSNWLVEICFAPELTGKRRMANVSREKNTQRTTHTGSATQVRLSKKVAVVTVVVAARLRTGLVLTELLTVQ